MCLLLLAKKNKTNSSFLDSSIFFPFFCGTNMQIQCSSWHKKLQLFLASWLETSAKLETWCPFDGGTIRQTWPLTFGGKTRRPFDGEQSEKCVPFCCGRLQTSIVLFAKLEIHSSLQDGVLFGWVQSYWPEMEILTILTTSDTMLGPRN